MYSLEFIVAGGKHPGGAFPMDDRKGIKGLG